MLLTYFQRENFVQLGMILADVGRTCLFLTMIHVLLDNKRVDAETFTLGYITGSKRRGEDLEYQRPGYRISGAITLAVEEASTAFSLSSCYNTSTSNRD